MSQKKPVAYNLYPICDDSDEEDVASPPGSLFKRYKLGKGSRDNNNSSSSSIAASTAEASSSSFTTTAHDDDEQQQAGAASSASDFALPTANDSDNWCNCGNCCEMTLVLEKKCCLSEMFEFTNFQDEAFRPGIDCVLSSSLLVDHVLGEIAQQLLWLTQQQYLGYRGNALLFEHMTNINYRHFAYKSYIKFMYGYLGSKNRKVIPACVVAYIRRRWPSPDGTYVGYKDADDSNDEEEGPTYIPADELAAILEGTEI